MIQLIFTTFVTWMTFCDFDKSNDNTPMNSTEESHILTTVKHESQNYSEIAGSSLALICRNWTPVAEKEIFRN